MTIQLSPQLEAALVNEATRRGTTPEVLAAQLIESQLPAAESRPANQSGSASCGNELDAWWKDHLQEVERASADAKGPTNLSQNTGRRFAELLQEQRRQGRL